MMFMVRIDVTLPASMSQTEKDDFRRRENENSMNLMKKGALKRIWRIVGRVANFSIWDVESLDELHAVLTGLPMFPFMDISVVPLVQHPLTEIWTAQEGPLPAL